MGGGKLARIGDHLRNLTLAEKGFEAVQIAGADHPDTKAGSQPKRLIKSRRDVSEDAFAMASSLQRPHGPRGSDAFQCMSSSERSLAHGGVRWWQSAGMSNRHWLHRNNVHSGMPSHHPVSSDRGLGGGPGTASAACGSFCELRMGNPSLNEADSLDDDGRGLEQVTPMLPAERTCQLHRPVRRFRAALESVSHCSGSVRAPRPEDPSIRAVAYSVLRHSVVSPSRRKD